MRTLENWLDYIGGTDWQNMDLGLDRMREVVTTLGLQQPAPRVVTVAGTNGKGSTVMGIEQLLLQAGLSVGATFSPHVHRFNERIRINGAMAQDADICEALQVVDAARGDVPLSYFEFAALASLWLFHREAVDVAVLEIGLGGRLDAFNVVDADVAVITSIGLDHEQFLGSDVERIGAEKAGILRPGQQVVLGRDMPHSVLAACAERQLVPEIAGVDFDVELSHGIWQLSSGYLDEPLTLPLRSLAPDNLALAWHAAAALVPLCASQLQAVNDTAQLPGRMQQVNVDGRVWLLDVAHNPAGAAFLARQLAHHGLEPALIVCGMLRDKQHAAVQAALGQVFDAPWLWVDTRGERAMSAADLAAAMPVTGCVLKWDDLRAKANSATSPGNVILLLGSFDVIEHFGAVLET